MLIRRYIGSLEINRRVPAERLEFLGLICIARVLFTREAEKAEGKKGKTREAKMDGRAAPRVRMRGHELLLRSAFRATGETPTRDPISGRA